MDRQGGDKATVPVSELMRLMNEARGVGRGMKPVVSTDSAGASVMDTSSVTWRNGYGFWGRSGRALCLDQLSHRGPSVDLNRLGDDRRHQLTV